MKKINVDRIARWAEKGLMEKRKEFEEKNKSTVPYASQPIKTENRIREEKRTIKRVTVH
jgi:hypothetical protein